MCGVVAVSFNADKAAFDPSRIRRAVSALAHRGPDGSGHYFGETFAVGHTRLAIIDPAPTGAQPMVSADGRFILTYNGEIYNFQELRRDLAARGVSLRGNSDTEVLLESFVIHGEALIDRLNGIYAFIIADLRNGEMLVARDPAGVKPLYMSEGLLCVAFSSEIKSLLEAMPIDRAFDHVAIQRYLTYQYCPGERTMLSAVRKVLPGAMLRVSNGRIVSREIKAHLPRYQPRRDWSIDQCARQLGVEVEAAVTRQMVSDAPLGAFLSGGVDSTSLVAAARRHAPNIQCFTMALQGGPAGELTDDLHYARLAAQHLGVNLIEVGVDQKDIIDRLSTMVFGLDEPLADPACLNTYFISHEAQARGIKVLLSGTGGDDVFSGYRRHQAIALDSYLRLLPCAVLKTLARAGQSKLLNKFGGRRLSKLMQGVDEEPDLRIARLFTWISPHEARMLLTYSLRQDTTERSVLAPMIEVLSERSEDPDLERCLSLDQSFFLGDHNLIYTDKMGMAAGVEIRVPLLDLELMSFAATIPAEWKMHHFTPKWMFKRSQKGRVPDFVLNRPKSGFGVPLRAWLRGPLREMTGDLLSRDSVVRRGFFEPDALERLMKANQLGEIDTSYTIFAAMCIEMWARRYVDSHSSLDHYPS